MQEHVCACLKAQGAVCACQFHLLFYYHRRDVPATSLLSWGVCVVCVFYSPILLLDLTTTNTGLWWKKKRGGKYSQVPDPTPSLRDKLSMVVEKLRSTLAFHSSPQLLCQDLNNQKFYLRSFPNLLNAIRCSCASTDGIYYQNNVLQRLLCSDVVLCAASIAWVLTSSGILLPSPCAVEAGENVPEVSLLFPQLTFSTCITSLYG